MLDLNSIVDAGFELGDERLDDRRKKLEIQGTTCEIIPRTNVMETEATSSLSRAGREMETEAGERSNRVVVL
jgi:hypothetical protein